MTNKLITKENLLAEKNIWENLVRDMLQETKRQGASAAEISITKGIGFSVIVRMGNVETIEYNRNKGVGITVYFGQKKGSSSTSDISETSIKDAITAACSFARLGSDDPYAGLPPAELMAKNYPDLDLYHPWNIDTDTAIQLAQQCENEARALDKRITNSEGVSLTTGQGYGLYANTHNFMGGYASSRHSISCSLVAQDATGMQRDGSYTVARDANDLESVSVVAKQSAERTVKRLGARRLKTCQAPVIFQAEVARSLISCFLSGISGGNLYRKSSFLVDCLGKPVFANHVNIAEKPHLLKGLASAPFDAEGVVTKDRLLVKNGTLLGYLLSSYSARKLGMQSTGNAGGAHNIILETSNYDLNDLLKQMGTGLLVTELLGHGINLVNGDYSQGAVGFWVENGVVQFPVEEITIAGNLQDMFANLVAIGNDIDKRGTIHTGSILLDQMMIGGQ